MVMHFKHTKEYKYDLVANKQSITTEYVTWSFIVINIIIKWDKEMMWTQSKIKMCSYKIKVMPDQY